MDREVLPPNVVPSHYVITLRPQLQEAVFTGEETITVEVRTPTNVILINANELEISSASISGGSLSAPLTAQVQLLKDTERASFTFEHALAVGQYHLHIQFSGILNDKMAGFYRSGYVSASGETRNMAVTQFEATDARRAFPCWDEPAVKATFDIVLNVPNDRVALSNMNVINDTPTEDGTRRLVTFAKTPIMSTYLVAFVVGELDFVEALTKEGIKVRVYTPPGLAEQGRFALDVATKTLTFFSEYFGEPYPLPKMDLVAVPDFAAGAMENWGLVTYRTIYLLYDEAKSSVKAKQNIAYIVGHELAHQWFGNLVTMAWWQDLWLNEGFATWVGWLAVDYLFPDWDVWTQFLVTEQNHGLKLDCLRSSHPIEVEVKSPAQINEIFDAISYSKGASVIRMLVSFLGSDVFVRGLRAYLQKHKYANASTSDLWKALSENSGVDVSGIMNSWTKQVGYPVITVAQDGSISQSRFLLSSERTAEEQALLWQVPLTFKTSTSDTFHALILANHSGHINIDDIQPNSQAYVKVNYGQSGFYRVKYDNVLLERLGRAVSINALSASDCVGIISDAFALCYAGELSTPQTLSLLLNFHQVESFVVWDDIVSSLSQIRSVWFNEEESVTERLKALARQLFGPHARKLGWTFQPNESHSTTLLRTMMIAGAGKAGDPTVVAQANELFSSFVAGSDIVHPNLRGPMFSIVIINGGEAEFNKVLKIYTESKLPDEKQAALVALGAIQQPHLVERAIQFAVSEEVRSQDIIYLFGSLGANPKGRHALWNYVQTNWDLLYQRYSGTFLLGRTVLSATEVFSSEEMAQQVEAFFASKKKEDLASIERTIRQALETIRSNAKWLNRDRVATAQWLQQNVAIAPANL